MDWDFLIALKSREILRINRLVKTWWSNFAERSDMVQKCKTLLGNAGELPYVLRESDLSSPDDEVK